MNHAHIDETWDRYLTSWQDGQEVNLMFPAEKITPFEAERITRAAGLTLGIDLVVESRLAGPMISVWAAPTDVVFHDA